GLGSAGETGPIHGPRHIQVDATGNESLLINQIEQRVSRARGSINEILAASDLANAEQTLHRISNGVQQRTAGVGKTTISEPPVRQLLSGYVLGVSDCGS